MILRGVTEHIKTQNWFAVGVELVILVLGVFIGIQVSNWNDERAERAREREVLSNMADDLRADRGILATGQRFATQTVNAANYALESAGFDPVRSITFGPGDVQELSGSHFTVPKPTRPSPEMTRRLWSLSVVRYYPTQSNAAFDSLVAAGDLSLIGNSELVRELQIYRQLWRSLEDTHNSTYRPFRERAVFVGQEFGLSPFSEMDESEFFALLASDPKLESSLRTLLEYTVLHTSQIEAVDNKAAELLGLLEQEGVIE